MTRHRCRAGELTGGKLTGGNLAPGRIGLWVLVFHQALPLLLLPTLSPGRDNLLEFRNPALTAIAPLARF
ncbi:MAG: hypothetical protein NVSMB43_10280 [Pseudarthrobacter sp.]